MSAEPRWRRVVRASAPTLIFALLFGGGVLVGQCFASRPTRRAIDDFLDRTTLGAFLDADERLAYANAYLDPGEAAARMDDYAWTVPVVPVPYVGAAPAPGRHANATINAQLLRHPTELAVPRPDGVLGIFVTGGSTAFGSGAPDQARTIPGYLQGLLDAEGLRTEVVNAASPSWASTHERLWILQHLVELDPDLGVSFSGNNDVHWGQLGRSVRWMRTHADKHFQSLLALAYGAAGRPLPEVVPAPAGRAPPEAVAWGLAANVEVVTHALGARGIPYVFALQPTLAVTGKTLSPREAARRRRLEERRGQGALRYFNDCYAAMTRSLRAAESAGFSFVDVSGVFDAEPAGVEIFLDSYHFGDRGNQQIARALHAALRPRIEALARAR